MVHGEEIDQEAAELHLVAGMDLAQARRHAMLGELPDAMIEDLIDMSRRLTS